jgi:hypothetical protein
MEKKKINKNDLERFALINEIHDLNERWQAFHKHYEYLEQKYDFKKSEFRVDKKTGDLYRIAR